MTIRICWKTKTKYLVPQANTQNRNIPAFEQQLKTNACRTQIVCNNKHNFCTSLKYFFGLQDQDNNIQFNMPLTKILMMGDILNLFIRLIYPTILVPYGKRKKKYIYSHNYAYTLCFKGSLLTPHKIL